MSHKNKEINTAIFLIDIYIFFLIVNTIEICRKIVYGPYFRDYFDHVGCMVKMKIIMDFNTAFTNIYVIQSR